MESQQNQDPEPQTSTTGYRGERTATLVEVTSTEKPNRKSHSAMLAIRAHYHEETQLKPAPGTPRADERDPETKKETSFTAGGYDVTLTVMGDTTPVEDQFSGLLERVKLVFADGEEE